MSMVEEKKKRRRKYVAEKNQTDQTK